MSPLTITVPLLAPSINGSGGLKRMHHRTYARCRDAWTLLTREAAGRWRLPKGGTCRITVTRHYCPHPLDLDNLYASAKVPLDALQRAGVIPDDNPAVLVDLSCSQERVATRKECRTTITIEPLP